MEWILLSMFCITDVENNEFRGDWIFFLQTPEREDRRINVMLKWCLDKRTKRQYKSSERFYGEIICFCLKFISHCSFIPSQQYELNRLCVHRWLWRGQFASVWWIHILGSSSLHAVLSWSVRYVLTHWHIFIFSRGTIHTYTFTVT